MRVFRVLFLALGMLFLMQNSIEANVPSTSDQINLFEKVIEPFEEERNIFFLGIKNGQDFFEMVKNALLDIEEISSGSAIIIPERKLSHKIWEEFEKVVKNQEIVEYEHSYYLMDNGKKEKFYIIFLK